MKLTILLAALCAVFALVSGPARAEDALPAPSQFLTDELYAQAAAWPGSDDRALAAVMRKAEAGENITVAVLGGSITQGTISQGSRDGEVPFKLAYAELFRRWWAERFPGVTVRFVNAGIGGTDSYLGLHRLDTDVLSARPDVVLLEYAVNDDGSKPLYKLSYDNLVRRTLEGETRPAVILLFMGQTNGATAQGIQAQIGAAYGLPMVSSHNAFRQAIQSGVYPAHVLSGDQVHPSALGHALTGEILWRYLNGVYARRAELEAPAAFAAPPFTEDRYLAPRILTCDSLTPDDLGTFSKGTGVYCSQYTRGWTNKEGAGGLTATMTFRSLGILFQRTTDGKSGRYTVWVDGEPAGTIDADFPGGWGWAITGQEVFTSDQAREHTVSVTLADGSAGRLILLGFMVSQ